MFINTHSHIYDQAFDNDREEALKRASEAGISLLIMPNDSLDSVAPMMRFYEQHQDCCRVMMGLHPENIKEDYVRQLSEIEKELDRECFIGIGEIGLDYYWDDTFKKEQIDALVTQLRWAKELKLPVSLHIRKAFDDIFRVLDKEQDGGLKGIFHCFGGTVEQMKNAVSLGFHIGIGGVVTYKNSHLAGIVPSIPDERIVLETDDPYLPPVPYRGQRNEPAYMVEVAKKIAELKEVPIDAVADFTTRNAKKLFSL